MLTQATISESTTARTIGWRCISVICIGLVLMAASLSACHIHAPASQTGPDHCQLCIALHPALPTTSIVAQMVMQDIRADVVYSPLRQYQRIWHFYLSSRPPPARAA